MLSTLPILIVSCEQQKRDRLASGVSEYGLRPVCCGSVAAASALINHQQFSLVLSEDVLPDGNFQSLVAHADRVARKFPVVVVSRRDDWDSYLKALGAGAFDYVAFPPNPGELERALWTALSESNLSD